MQNSRTEPSLPLKVAKALDYVRKNFGRNISLEEVADVAKMSRSSFCRLLKQTTGMTFTQHLNHVRLEEAKRLLSTSDIYIFHVAHKAGFRGLRYFRYLFKKRYGCSPTEYRDSIPPPPRRGNVSAQI